MFYCILIYFIDIESSGQFRNEIWIEWIPMASKWTFRHLKFKNEKQLLRIDRGKNSYFITKCV